MRYLLYSDNHFCQYSSILRGRGKKYSLRLENQLDTMSWIYDTAVDYKVDAIIHLGDFFDKPDLNAEELSALSEISWLDTIGIDQYYIVGNHEMGLNTNEYNSTKVLKLLEYGSVISEPMWWNDEIFILPYILESNRKPLAEYMGGKKADIILSHNDIKGIQMGQFISQTGFEVEEIQANCSLFINGHIHNGSNVAKGIINIGNITGQNFNEDATKYGHHIFILDTDNRSIEEIENPFALNFYKLTYEELKSTQLKNNAVISVKVMDKDVDECKRWLEIHNVLASRLNIEYTESEKEINTDVLTVDHLYKFREFVVNTLGNNEIVVSELDEVCK